MFINDAHEIFLVLFFQGSFGNFTFLMDLFTDKDYTTSYKSKDYPISVQINDPVYVQYQVLSEKGDLNVFAEKCLATTTTRPTSSPSYVFLDEGWVREFLRENKMYDLYIFWF